VNPRQRISQHRRNDTALRRAIIGSALRRALRAKDLRQRIEALTQSIGTLVARLLKRLPRGLACRRPIIAAPESPNVDGLCVFLTATLFADTS
jgi:hypothetical protein